ncbi:hypothetical protein T440DRAFT_481692 [Plenodomus tracheiphilus IPT5]|uniref:Uncharacterized protein n=1 Tax=Plenodomus tracheiphilus IPT5 TaxID=1408161 RepID=A0A6A7AW08_9PLEO|nr:hypothetical protein T440DRAFT_481692 [Plenodomus tracheiphilus IPT5]
MHTTCIHREYCEYCGIPFPRPPAPRSNANGVLQRDHTLDTFITWPYPNPRDHGIRNWVTFPLQSGSDDVIDDETMMTGGIGPVGTIDANGDHEAERDVKHALRAGRTEIERQRWIKTLLEEHEAAKERWTRFPRDVVPGYRELSKEEREQLRRDYDAAKVLRAVRAERGLRLPYNSQGDYIGPGDDEQDHDRAEEQSDVNIGTSEAA